MEDNQPGSFPKLGASKSNIALDAAIQDDSSGKSPKSPEKVNDSDGDGADEEELDVIQERLFQGGGHDDDETKFSYNQLDEQVAKRKATTIMKRSRNFSMDGTFDRAPAIPIPLSEGSGYGGSETGGIDAEWAGSLRKESMTPPAIAVLAHMQAASRENASSPLRGLGSAASLENNMPEPGIGMIQRSRTMSHDAMDGVAVSLEGIDTREILFENIPEPLPHTTQYSRLEIVEPDEGQDDYAASDTWESCRKIQKCLDMRQKWISGHPSAPQDSRPPLKSTMHAFGPPSSTSAPNMANLQPLQQPQNLAVDTSQHSTGSGGMTSPRRAKEPRAHPDDYRRRPILEYDVFNEPVPDFIKEDGGRKYDYFMRRGVVIVVPAATAVETDMAGLNFDEGDGGETWREGAAETKRNQGGGAIPMPPPLSPPAGGTTSKTQAGSPSPKSDPKEVRSHLAREGTNEKESVFQVPSFDEFLVDFRALRSAVHSGPVSSFCYKHLELLSAKFNLHVLLNSTRELDAQKSVPHRDFYNIRKVDTHVHHSASMSQKHLLRFIKHKLRHHPNEVVIERDGKPLTLGEVFVSLQLTAYDLSIDTLDMHAHDTFHRFDRFNLKYNPAGQSRLREIFLKTDNHIQGRYLAEMTQEVMNDLTASKYQLVEWRVSIYGRKRSEWDTLAQWFYKNRLAHPNVRWMIQIPRLYHNYRRVGQVASFQELLDNVFLPLFEITMDPASSPELHYLLETVVGIDSVDDESRPEFKSLAAGAAGLPTPDQWTQTENPPYGYWMYYTYANLCVLNQLRASRGLTTFKFRPHCGEAGDMDNLLAAFLTSDAINHGILLRKNASLQYLYYLAQIGIAMSPLSNNKLFLDYHKNPFPAYFKKGLNVSLSTDDPLMLHYTKDPLLEEYSVAAQVWKMSTTDICEVARNSVLQSGWDMRYKKHFLGKDLADIRETNVPEIRISYRQATLDYELSTIKRLSEKAGK